MHAIRANKVKVVTLLCTRGHVPRGWKTLQMHGFPVQKINMGKHSRGISLIQRSQPTVPTTLKSLLYGCCKANIERRTLLILAVYCLWLNYSAFIHANVRFTITDSIYMYTTIKSLIKVTPSPLR